jgi:mono/diheme cytochrome c family protein
VVTAVSAFSAPQQGASAPAVGNANDQRALLDKYCVSCHNDKARTAGLTLEKSAGDVAKPVETAQLWEKVIRKLRTGSMPPQGMPRPDQPAIGGLVNYLETSLDRAASAAPNPGRATLHRLNRTEYANAVKDLLNLDVDAAQLLPSDDESYGFDNIADVLKTSPSLLERYMSASWSISRLAVGNMSISPDTTTYRVRPDLSQDVRLEGMPLGTHGGTKFTHNFPLDGEYEFKVRLWRATTDIIRGIENRQTIEIAIDGVRAKLVSFGGGADKQLAYDNSGIHASDIDQRLTVRIPVKAGPRSVTVTFLTRSAAQDDDILQPFLRSNADPVGYQGQPVVDRVILQGPFNATGVSDTPARKAIFICRPKTASEEVGCARKIVSNLARKAYRRPPTDSDIESLLTFYQKGRNEGGSFDAGIEASIQLVLASPDFLFRFEQDPQNIAADSVYKLGDMELASRLSFFLWSRGPDDQLLNLASAGKLKDPAILEQQVKRMMADPRANAMVNNFAGQWLFLRNLKTVNPDFETFPDFDDNLRQAMRTETEMFFGSVMKEDRNVMDLLTADYTFVNERLARHYGYPNIYGNEFRRIQIPDANRRGILGQASVLTVTSLPTRTSAVQRGKWILSNLLNTPPPAPPPNVPALKANEAGAAPKSLRERMEAHRANPYCSACHKVMDPLGFSLENFDAVGQYRMSDEGAKIDITGVLFNGTKVEQPTDLGKMIASRPEVFVGVFTEKMMIYALGRGIEYYDMPTVRQIVRDSAKNNYRFSSIVMGVIKSNAFQMKRKMAEGNLSAANRPVVQ